MKRAWTVEVDPLDPDREEALADAINEAGRAIATLDRVGGTLIVSSLRQRTEQMIGSEPEYLTIGYIFTWDSYAPGVELPTAVGQAEPGGEDDLDAVTGEREPEHELVDERIPAEPVAAG